MLVIDERTGNIVDRYKYDRGIVAIYQLNDRVCFEYGFFKPDFDTILFYNTFNGCVTPCINKNISPNIIFSKKIGYYILAPQRFVERMEHSLIRGNGSYPYNINREYEADKSFDIFKGAQKIIENNEFPISKYLKYTFGVEFETSGGYVPQDICFRDGLIPLRDGSITGVEYSTVVMGGNDGLNLLKQQCQTLKYYTEFNKNCALHIHFGGYPVNPLKIFVLYRILYYLQDDIEILIPPLSFHSAEYKENGKDYCAKLPFFKTFDEFYTYIADGKIKFMGDLYQAHPDDIEHERKWQINSRYHNFNFVNMLFYDKAKTLELRFLRPSFNFNKILLWITIFNGILLFAEKESDLLTLKEIEQSRLKYSRMGLLRIFEDVYPEEIIDYLVDGLIKLKCLTKSQVLSGDKIGADINLEDDIFN